MAISLVCDRLYCHNLYLSERGPYSLSKLCNFFKIVRWYQKLWTESYRCTEKDKNFKFRVFVKMCRLSGISAVKLALWIFFWKLNIPLSKLCSFVKLVCLFPKLCPLKYGCRENFKHWVCQNLPKLWPYLGCLVGQLESLGIILKDSKYPF